MEQLRAIFKQTTTILMRYISIKHMIWQHGVLISSSWLSKWWYFICMQVLWEPFVEPWKFQLSISRKHDYSSLLDGAMMTHAHLKSTTQLNLNLTESLIEVYKRFVLKKCLSSMVKLTWFTYWICLSNMVAWPMGLSSSCWLSCVYDIWRINPPTLGSEPVILNTKCFSFWKIFPFAVSPPMLHRFPFSLYIQEISFCFPVLCDVGECFFGSIPIGQHRRRGSFCRNELDRCCSQLDP